MVDRPKTFFPTDLYPKAKLMNRLAMKASLTLLAPLVAVIIPIIAIDVQADDIGNVEVESPQPFVQDNFPVFDPINEPVNNGDYFSTFLARGSELIKHPDAKNFEDLKSDLKKAPRSANLPVPAESAADGVSVFQLMMEASVIVGSIYDCGRCSNLHPNISGGVIISSDGLVLTNHHVIDRSDSGIKGMLVMTHDGCAYPIVEVLAGSRRSDVALIRIKADRPLRAAPLADAAPMAMDAINVISHPQNEFYVLTQGVVSRHAKPTLTGDRGTWMEITATFAGGSSGSGVFNARGEVVGLVSRIYPLFRTSENDATPTANAGEAASFDKYAEMILRRCVPHQALVACFSGSQSEPENEPESVEE